MRRKDRILTDSETIAILQKGEHGVLSICTINNEGYGIPLNYVYHNNLIYFHCAHEGAKLNYLRNNNKVAFCVVGKTEILPSHFGTIYESAIALGETSEVEAEEKREALVQIIEKYSGNFIREGNDYIDKFFDRVTVIKLNIETITGKARKQ